jgi:hypothetical protein
MMNPFPDDWQLIGLFESEPALLDPGLPWVYNRLTFQTQRGCDRIVSEIEPASEILTIRWWHQGELRLNLDLRWVSSLTVCLEGKDALIANFRGGVCLDPLELQLRPRLLLSWSGGC